MALANLWRFRNSKHWISPFHSTHGLPHGSFESVSRARLFKRVFAIIVTSLLLSRIPFLKLGEVARYPIYKPPISISDALTIQRTVFSLSSKGLMILGEIPSQRITPLPVEQIHAALLTRSIPGIHLLIFWGLGRKAREPYVRAFLWCLSSLFGGVWHRVRSRWRPKIDTDLESITTPYYRGPTLPPKAALPLGPLRSSTIKHPMTPSPNTSSFDSGVETGSLQTEPSDATPTSSMSSKDGSSAPPQYLASDTSPLSTAPRFLTSSKDRSTAPPRFSASEDRPQPPPYSKIDLSRHTARAPT